MNGAIVLERDGQRAEVDACGAALRSWTAGGTERLSSVERSDPSHAFDGATLMPWPNRIRDGAYAFAGRRHQLPVDDPTHGSALHGLATRAEWAVVEQGADAVRLRRGAGPAPGYPFAVEVEVEYRLAPGGLVAALVAVNHGEEAAPFGCGSHPYLRADHGVDAVHLSVPAASVVPVDGRLLPIGPPQPVDDGLDRTLGRTALDACFGDLRRHADGLARVRVRPAPDEPAITLWLDGGFPFVHVYTGDQDPDPARRRTRLAVEPVTCAPDAFNTGLGLLTLQPGERFSARWGLEIDQGAPR